MQKNKRFLSLKWKFAFGLGFVLISLYSAYAYYVYYQVVDNFSNSRAAAQKNQINIARALTEESFFVLDRFVESIILMQYGEKEVDEQVLQLFDQHWQHWQVIWGLENAVFYDRQGIVIKQWGKDIKTAPEIILRAFTQETPQHQIVCDQGCFQQILTPVLLNSEVVGVLSVSVSLSDTLLQYRQAIHSDLGVLTNGNSKTLAAMTQAEKNNLLWQEVIASYGLDAFFDAGFIFIKDKQRYELRVFPMSKNVFSAPYFVMINEITEDYNSLQKKLFQLGIIGLVGLFLIILILFITIHFTLERITQLSQALPLLVQHQYQGFKQKLNSQSSAIFRDEVNHLSETAAYVARELEVLDNNVEKNTALLLRNSQELEEERDFVAQLIDTAPIFIITQNMQGKILSVNKEVLIDMGVNAAEIVGKSFAMLISDKEHAHKLEILRQNNGSKEITFDDQLSLLTEGSIYISWIHTILRAKNTHQEPVVLSLGVDVTERHVADEQLIWLAGHDPLTGLGNRRHFQHELDNMLAIAERYKEQVALFYLDLDQFKIINDTHGHQAGDELLQVIANVLKTEIRETDLLSRIGGDEFTLVTPTATLEGVEILANKMLHTLTQIEYTINEQPHPVSFSIGVAIYPQHGQTQQELLANADLAMYHAKKTGRSRYHIFSPEFGYQTLLTEQLRWKHIIEGAIKQDEFVLYYQPILDIKRKEISHYECLLRIQQKDGTLLMPGDFIAQAEQIGIIDQIDHLVLRKAIERHLAFQSIGNNARLAINLSGRSMNDMDILPYIEQLLSQPGVKPELIIFEITETSAVSNFMSAKSMIKRLKALGCCFALDDFGVGFSSFYYLKSLPVDYVKIDGSFVKQMDTSEEDRIFVKVLTEVSQAFGKKIIAEFVENKDILDLLEQQGVDYAQGYYISKPIFDPLDLSHVKGLE
ncbi:MAG: EAL domain-containing protein [Methylococcaceae bacterium]|nr:EAL domain-containing protein [Methylococcaceae bacterium]